MDYLYLGALYNSRNFNELYEYLHIRSILNAAIECGNYFPDSFEYLKCDLYDEISEDISKHME